MRQRRGIVKVGSFKGIELMINWDYLLKEHGLRKELEDFERKLGRLLLLVGISLLLIPAVVLSMQNRFFVLEIFKSENIFAVVFWLGFEVVLYSFYLARSREYFIDRVRTGSLEDLQKQIDNGKPPADIEITAYFDHDLLNVVDDILQADEHKFMGLLISELTTYPKVADALKRLGISKEELLVASQKFSASKTTHVEQWLDKVIVNSFIEAFNLSLPKADELSTLVYVCKTALKDELLDFDVYEKEVNALGLWIKNQSDLMRYRLLFAEKSALKPTSTVNRAFTSRYSPTLVKFSQDFTAEIARGKFLYSLAREKEILDLIDLIQTGEKSVTLLVGPPGVGKTTILKSLALRMVVEEVPDALKDKRLVAFDFNRAYALSKNADDFKRSVEKVLEETAATGNIVLVLDDFDQVVSIKEEVASEVINIFISALDKHKLRIIATSTQEGFVRKIKPQRALVAMFNVLEINEPHDEVAVQILMDMLPELEKQNHVSISFDAIVKLVGLSHKVSLEKVLPDKAIDLLDEIITEAKGQNLTFVNEQLVEQVVSSKVGVKLGAVDSKEAKVLMHLEDELHKRLIGQNEAVKAVSAALRRSRAGLVSGKRPVASFLFFGPTGVGKTELSKALTEVYFGDAKLMVRVDMSEYQEEENLKRLIGEQGEKGFEGGYLTEAVRSRPFSLVLLDEIEKANPKVLDLFLQILDEGAVNDGLGRRIDFTNTIIIATSNVGSKEIADLVAKGNNYDTIARQITPRLREFLRVEFLNRFDKVIMFRPLSPIEVEQVTVLMLNTLVKQLADKGIEMQYTNELVIELARIGYNPVYGARELRRVVQEQLEDKIAELIVSGKLESGKVVVVNNLSNLQIKDA